MRHLALIVCFLWLAQSAAHAGESEQRDYAILVNGKDSGQSRIIITTEQDGTTTVAANCQVKIAHLLLPLNLSVESTERWKDGKLIGLKASSVENAKRTEVTAAGDGKQLTVTVNGRDRAGFVDDWVSSFWKLPDARFHNKAIPVLESDTGKEYTCQLQYIGTDQLTLLSQPQSCFHFRVTGGPYPVDVWFDRFHRLVRQEFVDTGHKTIVQLIGLKR